ncbi:MAG: hypothetical protein HQM00_11915, partial [Magnetococcales bacterium]|nr:hypothetical protein [Magnetococcales bacterium]
VAVLMASPTGGTIGAAMAILMARGGELILPVSLAKLIPSVSAACRLTGQGRAIRVMGSPVGYMPILAGSATVITEVEAVRVISSGRVRATPLAAGGLDDCEGALVLALEGARAAVEAMMDHLETMRRIWSESGGDPA